MYSCTRSVKVETNVNMTIKSPANTERVQSILVRSKPRRHIVGIGVL